MPCEESGAGPLVAALFSEALNTGPWVEWDSWEGEACNRGCVIETEQAERAGQRLCSNLSLITF